MTTAATRPDAFRIDVTRADRLIAETLPAYSTLPVSLSQSHGQVLRQTVIAERDQPPFNRATMDGIALRSAALSSGSRRYRVAGIQGAGQSQLTLPADTSEQSHCCEIMTGAVVPAGCDTVVPVERIEQNDEWVQLEAGYQPEPGQFVHRQGTDHLAGDTLLEPGTLIGAPEMAILTAAGQPTVQIARWPRVAIISTGDELVDVGEPLADCQIRSSNDRAIETCLQLNGCQTTQRCRLPDDPTALEQEIQQLHADNDVLILSGGVSMGKYDYIPAILERLQVRVVFHKILQRPGLPMWFGISAANKPVFALPGNPVSTTVCCVRYVLPALRQALGLDAPFQETVALAESVDFAPDLTWFLPVRLHTGSSGLPEALPRPTNTSGDFVGLRNTHGFVELPQGQDHFPAGFVAKLYRW